jgi:hypothetical protein
MTDDALPVTGPGPIAPSEAPSPDTDMVVPDVSDDERIVPDPSAKAQRPALLALSALLTLGSLFGLLSASGVWDPHELKIADLGRRIAVALLGAKSLVIEGGVNQVPTTGELGRGELPFSSIAAGFRIFGLHEWAGRLPMALWGLVGVLAMGLFVARLVDRVAAAFAVMALVTMPLYFLQARTMLGDIVTMSGLAVAVTGTSLAVFDLRLKPGARILHWLVGFAGIAAAFGARGVFFGVAVPAFSVGIAWLVRRGATDRLGGIFALLCLALGVGGAGLGLRALFGPSDHPFIRLLGAAVDARHTGTLTHDAVVLQLGHALFPWSAVVPFALGRLLRAPVGVEGDAFEREASGRVVLLVTAIVAFGVSTALAPVTGVIPFGAVFALAAAVGVAFRDFERGAPGSRTLALGVAALLVLFLGDFKNFPEKGLSAFVVDDAKFPESFKDLGLTIVEIGTLASASLFALFFFEREEGQKVFDREEHRRYVRELRAAYEGNINFALLALEAALVVLAVVVLVSDHGAHVRQLEGLAPPVHLLALFGFLALPVLVFSPNAVMLLRDGVRVLMRRLKVTRASAAVCAVTAFGAAMSFGYYPLLARQISPKEVFESFQRLAKPGEDLAMMIGLGSGVGSARYYAHRDVRTFTSTQEAFSWLNEGGEKNRRWLVVRAPEIAQMNSDYRSRQAPPKNLPVLDARSSEILLVSNVLRPGETSENQFDKWLPQTRPSPQHPLDVDFNGQLHCLGWSVTTPAGDPVPSVRAGKPYVFHLYYEVTKPISGEWQTFIHVDGYQRRYNGDHDTLEGKYSFRFWHAGDFVQDTHAFELEPNFTTGTYTFFFGLFRGDQRLEVKRGQTEDNRVNGGPLMVE